MKTLNVPTTWGMIYVTFSAKGLVSLDLPNESSLNMADSNLHEKANINGNYDRTISLLKGYFNGSPVDFNNLKVDLSTYTPFFRDICRAVQSIPYGKIRTYGELAEMAGRKGAARAVGKVMASNPLPIIIPCHRVVSSDGTLTGYSAPGGLNTKKKLLAMEGLSFDKRGRVIK